MKPIGTWNGIKHYCLIKKFSLNDFCDLIEINELDKIKLSLIGKQGYKIEVRPHPTNNINDAGLSEIAGKKIIVYVPGKLDGADSYVLFGSGNELEFTKTQLCNTFATELRNSLDYVWNNLLPTEIYVEYLKRTIIWP